MKETNRKLHDEGMENSLRGKGKDVKGRVKDAAGGLTGDSGLQAEGKWDRVKGKVQDKVGGIQRRISRDTDSSDR
jgi:uncharacterized protein YjbJ (UPF0337 family)